MAEAQPNKEGEILKAVKRVLTEVIKDTATKPGMLHPLAENTMNGMRDCLVLITQREKELAEQAGVSQNQRPRFIDEPKAEVRIPIDTLTKTRS
jgi:hypothetical protein